MSLCRRLLAQEVVLYQYDLADPMNPLGLLVAYAEAHVLPARRLVQERRTADCRDRIECNGHHLWTVKVWKTMAYWALFKGLWS